MWRLPDPDITRLLGKVSGRHVAPIALVDLHGDPEPEGGVAEADALHPVRLAMGRRHDGQIVEAAAGQRHRSGFPRPLVRRVYGC